MWAFISWLSIYSFTCSLQAYYPLLFDNWQDLVCKTFYELWFEEPSECQTQFVGDGSSIPMEVAMKTEQIVDMLRKMPNHHFLVTIIKRNLALDFLPQSAKSAGINAISLASVRKRCELICKRLLERILQVFHLLDSDLFLARFVYLFMFSVSQSCHLCR